MCVAARLVKGLSSGANTWKSLEHCRAAIMMPARIHSSSLMLEHTHRARGSRAATAWAARWMSSLRFESCSSRLGSLSRAGCSGPLAGSKRWTHTHA